VWVLVLQAPREGAQQMCLVSGKDKARSGVKSRSSACAARGSATSAAPALTHAFKRYRALSNKFDEASWQNLGPVAQARLVEEARQDTHTRAHTHIHTHTHTHTYAHAHTHIHAHTHTLQSSAKTCNRSRAACSHRHFVLSGGRPHMQGGCLGHERIVLLDSIFRFSSEA
jgi:hypothetical protein